MEGSSHPPKKEKLSNQTAFATACEIHFRAVARSLLSLECLSRRRMCLGQHHRAESTSTWATVKWHRYGCCILQHSRPAVPCAALLPAAQLHPLSWSTASATLRSPLRTLSSESPGSPGHQQVLGLPVGAGWPAWGGGQGDWHRAQPSIDTSAICAPMTEGGWPLMVHRGLLEAGSP